jgi:hypothetical protein
MFKSAIIGVFLGTLSATIAAPPSEDKKTDYQAVADKSEWRWEPEMASPLYSLCNGCDGSYQVEIVRKKGESNVTYRFTDGKREIYSWKGHIHTVFVQEGPILYYADFDPIAAGCSINAYDLKGGKLLWTTKLNGSEVRAHSKYSNEVILQLKEDRVLQIWGHEAFGDYLEFVDCTTGNTVGHKLFDK